MVGRGKLRGNPPAQPVKGWRLVEALAIVIIAFAMAAVGGQKSYAGGSYPDGSTMTSDPPRCVGAAVHQNFVISNTNYYGESDYFQVVIQTPTGFTMLGLTYIAFDATATIDVTLPSSLTASSSYEVYPAAATDPQSAWVGNDGASESFVVPDCPSKPETCYASVDVPNPYPGAIPAYDLYIDGGVSDGPLHPVKKGQNLVAGPFAGPCGATWSLQRRGDGPEQPKVIASGTFSPA